MRMLCCAVGSWEPCLIQYDNDVNLLLEDILVEAQAMSTRSLRKQMGALASA